MIEQNWKIDEFNLYWDKHLVQTSLRPFIRKMVETKNTIKWFNQTRFEKIWNINQPRTINWESTWHNIFNCKKFTKSSRVFNSVYDRSYKIKLLMNELPTLETLHKRNPKLYTDSMCPRCQENNEDQIHIWMCSANKTSVTEISHIEIHSMLEKIKNKEKNSNNNKETINYQALKLRLLNLPYFNHNNEACTLVLLRGFVPSEIQTCLEEQKIPKSKISKLAKSLCKKILEKSKEKIWKERCDSVI